MVDVFFPLVFHTKIVDNECEGNRTGSMFPKSGRVLAFVITVGGEAFAQEFVRKDAGLWEAPNSLAHLEVNESTDDFIVEVVLFDDPRGEEFERHFHIFVAVQGRGEVKIADV